MRQKQRMVYFINETERDPITGGYIPCIAVEGTAGYYKTDWVWSDDYEQCRKLAEQKNDEGGYTPKDAWLIIAETIRLQKEGQIIGSLPRS